MPSASLVPAAIDLRHARRRRRAAGAARRAARLRRRAPGRRFPYLTFGQCTARDWSTGSEDGNEHILTLHVWSQANGKKQAHEIMGAIRTALHDQPLALAGHRLSTCATSSPKPAATPTATPSTASPASAP